MLMQSQFVVLDGCSYYAPFVTPPPTNNFFFIHLVDAIDDAALWKVV